VAIVFMHQPLPFHDKAMGAALAMQAAQRQGKAWQMHDVMFENNTALAPEDLEKYAGQIGLDVERFKKDVADPKLKEEVLADQKIANSVGATGTPAFFINGRNVTGAQPFEAFKTIIDEELVKVAELLKDGTPIDQIYEKRSKTK
jgi:protein-disulfide isomerase